MRLLGIYRYWKGAQTAHLAAQALNLLSGAGKNNFIYAELGKKGVIDFAIEAPKGASIRGRELYKSMMSHYGGNAKGIGGNWTYVTNLAKVNELSKGHIPNMDWNRS